MRKRIVIAVMLCLFNSGCMSFGYEEELTRKRKVRYDNPIVELAKVVLGTAPPSGPVVTTSSRTPKNMGHFYGGGK